jgi:hypothetical protein
MTKFLQVITEKLANRLHVIDVAVNKCEGRIQDEQSNGVSL